MTDNHEDSDILPDLVLDIENDEENMSVKNKELSCPETYQNNILDIEAAGPSHSGVKTKHSNNDEKSANTESRATPRRAQYSNSRGTSKLKQQCSSTQGNGRLCEQHTFRTDITEVRQMEQGLLKLLDDFHHGKLQAFGKDCMFEKMEQVREQQERLARLHFELNAQQEMYGPQSEEGRRVSRDNLGKLVESLQQLSRSIEQLQISSPSVQTDV